MRCASWWCKRKNKKPKIFKIWVPKSLKIPMQAWLKVLSIKYSIAFDWSTVSNIRIRITISLAIPSIENATETHLDPLFSFNVQYSVVLRLFASFCILLGAKLSDSASREVIKYWFSHNLALLNVALIHAYAFAEQSAPFDNEAVAFSLSALGLECIELHWLLSVSASNYARMLGNKCHFATRCNEFTIRSD